MSYLSCYWYAYNVCLFTINMLSWQHRRLCYLKDEIFEFSLLSSQESKEKVCKTFFQVEKKKVDVCLVNWPNEKRIKLFVIRFVVYSNCSGVKFSNDVLWTILIFSFDNLVWFLQEIAKLNPREIRLISKTLFFLFFVKLRE